MLRGILIGKQGKMLLIVFYMYLVHVSFVSLYFKFKKVSEYNQKISQLHTADQPRAPRGRATEH